MSVYCGAASPVSDVMSPMVMVLAVTPGPAAAAGATPTPTEATMPHVTSATALEKVG